MPSLLFTLITILLLSTLPFSSFQASPALLNTPRRLFTPSISFLNAYATKNGNISFTRDENGFFATVDLNSFYSDASDSGYNPESVSMTLNLYTSQTIIMNQNCLNFSTVSCSLPTCDGFPSATTSWDMLYFSAEGYEASALTYLDYNHWGLEDYATMVTNCSSNTTSSYGTSRTGMIGMGINLNGQNNFIGTPRFSIFVQPGMWGGHMVFGIYNGYEVKNISNVSIRTDENWIIDATKNTTLHIGNFTTNGTNFTMPIQVKIMFAMEQETMGLPLAIYNSVVGHFGANFQCSSSDVYILPECNYSGNVSLLPNMTIHTHNKSIVIPPNIYVQNFTNITGNVSSINLNIRALDPSLNGSSYVTLQYNGSIVFGLSFMAYYYTMFNSTIINKNMTSLDGGHFTNFTILIAEAGTPPAWSGSVTSSEVWIIVGVIGLIILLGIGACVYFYIKNKKKIKAKREKMALMASHETLGLATV